jgi:hypothetical protein
MRINLHKAFLNQNDNILFKILFGIKNKTESLIFNFKFIFKNDSRDFLISPDNL